jgi:hypothetical protein
VEVLGSINGWNWEAVASSITSGVVFVQSGCGVEWLMDITSVVHHESHGSRDTFGFTVALLSVAHDLFVLVVGGVVVLLVDPVSEAVDDSNNGVLFLLEVWEVRDTTTLIEEWSINEVPIGLIRATLKFNVISESGAFNKWMFALKLGPRWIGFLEYGEDILNLSNGGIIEKLVSNSGDEEMTISPPGAGLTEKSKCNYFVFHLNFD